MTRISKLLSDERELTPEEQEEIDLKAKEITANIFFGTGEQSETAKAADEKGADQAAAVSVKKRPGRPKKDPQTQQRNDQNEVRGPENPQRGLSVIPEEVRMAVSEKISIITRTIESYEEQIEELKSDCQRNIELFEGYKRESQDKLKVLRDFLKGAEHEQQRPVLYL